MNSQTVGRKTPGLASVETVTDSSRAPGYKSHGRRPTITDGPIRKVEQNHVQEFVCPTQRVTMGILG
jgi:hypothetical protein